MSCHLPLCSASFENFKHANILIETHLGTWAILAICHAWQPVTHRWQQKSASDVNASRVCLHHISGNSQSLSHLQMIKQECGNIYCAVLLYSAKVTVVQRLMQLMVGRYYAVNLFAFIFMHSLEIMLQCVCHVLVILLCWTVDFAQVCFM